MTAITDTLVNGDKFLAKDQVIFDPNIFKTSVFIILVGGGINTFSSYNQVKILFKGSQQQQILNN